MEQHIDKIGLKKEDATLTEQSGIMEFIKFPKMWGESGHLC